MMEIRVKFDDRVPMKLRGPALMRFEGYLRDHGVPANVVLDRLPDDLKSRRMMTPEERAKL